MNTPHEDAGTLREDLAANNPIRRENAAALAPTSYPSAAELRSRPADGGTHSAPVTSVGNKRRIAWVAAAAVVALSVGGVLFNQFGPQRNQVAVEPSPTPSPATPTNTNDKLPLTTRDGSLTLSERNQKMMIAGEELTIREALIPQNGYLASVGNHPHANSRFVQFRPGPGSTVGYNFYLTYDPETKVFNPNKPINVYSATRFTVDDKIIRRNTELGKDWWLKHDPKTVDIETLKSLHYAILRNKPDHDKRHELSITIPLMADVGMVTMPVEERAAVLTVLKRHPDVTMTWENDADSKKVLVIKPAGVEGYSEDYEVRLDSENGMEFNSDEQASKAVTAIPQPYLDAFENLEKNGTCSTDDGVTHCEPRK